MIRHAARCGRRLAGVILLALACTGWWAPGAAQRTARQTRTEVALEGRFEGKNGKPAGDLSGIACQPPVAGEHACLVVNDESPFAQLATLRGRRLLAGRTVDLIAGRGARLADGAPLEGVFGSEPAARPSAAGRCPDRGIGEDFDDLDGEGVAWAPAASGGGAFYVVGSHACGRGRGDRRRSTHLLARLRVDGAGQPAGQPELTWRLGEALRHADQVGAHYGLPLDPARQGLDIEGVAALGDGEDLLFGLRAPSLGGHAFVVRAHAAELFAPGTGSAPSARVARLPLGEGVGIRDLAALPDGRLLVLSGAAQSQAGVPQGLAVAVPGAQPVWAVHPLLPRIEAPRAEAKAEGIAVLAAAGGTLTVLVLFEDASRDTPLEYVLPLPP
jgi:hypothetical protein